LARYACFCKDRMVLIVRLRYVLIICAKVV